MPRPKIKRRIRCKPNCNCYNPVGGSGGTTQIERDEYQAIKLVDVDNLNQKESAKKMNISQPTFARILQSARKKISKALINGEVIKII